MKKVMTLGVLGLTSLYGGAQPESYPPGQLGEFVKLGEAIFHHTGTHPLSKKYVTNKLTCKNCHPAGKDGRGGTKETPTSTLLGAAAAYPARSGKQGTIITLQDRISDCFMDCMSGPRSPIDSDVNIALAAYIGWLSHGHQYRMNEEQPINAISNAAWKQGKEKFSVLQEKATHKNYLRGQKLFGEKCAACHGKNGEGLGTNPPLWGKDKKTGTWLAYDANSGLAALHKAATWIQQNMPFGAEGTLNDQDAADIALYLAAQPHEDFNTKKALRHTTGIYRSLYKDRTETVRNQFKKFHLDIDKIRGDHLIPK